MSKNFAYYIKQYGTFTDGDFQFASRKKTTGEYNYPAPHPLAINYDPDWKSQTHLDFQVEESIHKNIVDAFNFLETHGNKNRVYSLYLTYDGKTMHLGCYLFGTNCVPGYSAGWRPKTALGMTHFTNQYNKDKSKKKSS